VSLIYKILAAEAWAQAKAAGVFEGSPVDHADGYIHFSTAEQAQETARRHFAGQTGLVLLSVDTEGLGQALRWEPSRGGDLFPHLYSALPTSAVIAACAIALGPDGAPDVAALLP
jgi:uncharacterized protein (DUF952 family)